MLSLLLKGPFNSLSPSLPPPPDLPGIQDTGTFITPLKTLKGTNLFFFFLPVPPLREMSLLTGHQSYVPAVTHKPLRPQDNLPVGLLSQHLLWAQMAPRVRFKAWQREGLRERMCYQPGTKSISCYLFPFSVSEGPGRSPEVLAGWQ